MKNSTITLLLFLVSITGFTQDFNYDVPGKNSNGFAGNLYYEVSGTGSNTVTKEKLSAVKTMRDINPGYPSSSWITQYISAEVLATGNGKIMKAVSANDILSEEQKNILKMADLGTDVVIDVTYKQVNAITDNLDIRKMHISYTVIPEIEAEYLGGYEQMKKYLKETAINKISETDYEKLRAAVRFTVNEQGEIANAQVSKTSGNQNTDKLLVEAINKMPKWKPAENSKGIKVKQEFIFNVGSGGC